MRRDISAYIIAGGKSTRFGSDKSLYRFRGKILLKHVYDVLSPVFENIFIISGSEQNERISGVEEIKDVIPGLGPLGGIYTALLHSDMKRVFISACDTPFLSADLISYMVNLNSNHDIIIPEVGEHYEPLHAVYSETCIEPVKSLIDRGGKKVIGFFNEVKVKTVNENEIRRFGDPEIIFSNINYPEDVTAITEKREV